MAKIKCDEYFGVKVKNRYKCSNLAIFFFKAVGRNGIVYHYARCKEHEIKIPQNSSKEEYIISNIMES